MRNMRPLRPGQQSVKMAKVSGRSLPHVEGRGPERRPSSRARMATPRIGPRGAAGPVRVLRNGAMHLSPRAGCRRELLFPFAQSTFSDDVIYVGARTCTSPHVKFTSLSHRPSSKARRRSRASWDSTTPRQWYVLPRARADRPLTPRCDVPRRPGLSSRNAARCLS